MISFQEAAANLERICDTIDSAEEISEHLEAAFAGASSEFAYVVDKRISYMKYCESQISSAIDMIDQWTERAQRFQRILDRIKKDTINTVKANPSIPYRGKLGSIRVQRNSVPALVLDEAKFNGEKYVEVKTVIGINKTAVIQDLKKGEQIPGAKLEYGEHVRIGLAK